MTPATAAPDDAPASAAPPRRTARRRPERRAAPAEAAAPRQRSGLHTPPRRARNGAAAAVAAVGLTPSRTPTASPASSSRCGCCIEDAAPAPTAYFEAHFADVCSAEQLSVDDLTLLLQEYKWLSRAVPCNRPSPDPGGGGGGAVVQARLVDRYDDES